MEVLVLNSEAKKQTILGYVFLIPSLAVFAVFMFYPLFYTFYLSFFEWNMVKPVKKFVGLANYISVFKDPNNWKIFGNTMIYIVILLAFNFVMPYILSFILSCVIKKGKGAVALANIFCWAAALLYAQMASKSVTFSMPFFINAVHSQASLSACLISGCFVFNYQNLCPF